MTILYHLFKEYLGGESPGLFNFQVRAERAKNRTERRRGDLEHGRQ